MFLTTYTGATISEIMPNQPMARVVSVNFQNDRWIHARQRNASKCVSYRLKKAPMFCENDTSTVGTCARHDLHHEGSASVVFPSTSSSCCAAQRTTLQPRSPHGRS